MTANPLPPSPLAGLTLDVLHTNVHHGIEWAGPEPQDVAIQSLDEIMRRLRAAEADGKRRAKIGWQLAALGLQSDRYLHDREFRATVDEALIVFDSPAAQSPSPEPSR